MLIFCFLVTSLIFALEVDLKDIINVGSEKKNFFTGYGLVVGLGGTGDRRSVYTSESLKNILKNYGLRGVNQDLSPRNVASVIVSAETSGYLNKGDLVDITVASIGDARSIDNGFLIASPLRNSGGTTYLVGSGIITTEADHLTRGRIASGGIVERDFSEIALNEYTFPLNLKLNSYYSGNILDIKNKLSESFREQLNVIVLGQKRLSLSLTSSDTNSDRENQDQLIQDILSTKIEIETRNKVVIDTETGIVVSGKNLAIDSSYISLPLENNGQNNNLLGTGFFTDETSNSNPEVKNSFATIGELFDYLNSRNENIRDKIPSLLYALRRSGVLNAEIILQ